MKLSPLKHSPIGTPRYNLRIIDTARRIGIDKAMINIEKYGNTTAATIRCAFGNGNAN